MRSRRYFRRTPLPDLLARIALLRSGYWPGCGYHAYVEFCHLRLGVNHRLRDSYSPSAVRLIKMAAEDMLLEYEREGERFTFRQFSEGVDRRARKAHR